MLSQQEIERLRVEGFKRIGEDKELTPKKIAKLKRVIQDKNPYMKIHPSSYDAVYLSCLRTCGFDIERAAALYVKFCSLRDISRPGVMDLAFKNDYVNTAFRSRTWSVSKLRDPEGNMLLLLQAKSWNLKELSGMGLAFSFMEFADELALRPDSQVIGIKFIADFEGLSFAQCRSLTLECILGLGRAITGYCPVRIKETHLVNYPSYFNLPLAIAKKVVFNTDQLKKSLLLHGFDLSSLYNAIDPSVLPESLGGSVKNEDWYDTTYEDSLEKKENYYKDFLQYGYGATLK